MKTGNLVIIKLGGSVLTRKKHNEKKIDKDSLKRLSKEIRSAMTEDLRLIIVHGVGSFGHIISKKYSLVEGFTGEEQIKAISALRYDLAKLNLEISRELRHCGINVVTFHPSSLFYSDSGKLKSKNFQSISESLKLGLTPMLYGDIIFDEKRGFGILSGDSIILHLAKYFKPNRIIIGTDVDGVFDRDPNINRNARLIRSINGRNIGSVDLSQSTAIDVTGGMKGKIGELLKLLPFSQQSQIINISKPNVLKKALLGNTNLGTTIKP